MDVQLYVTKELTSILRVTHTHTHTRVHQQNERENARQRLMTLHTTFARGSSNFPSVSVPTGYYAEEEELRRQASEEGESGGRDDSGGGGGVGVGGTFGEHDGMLVVNMSSPPSPPISHPPHKPPEVRDGVRPPHLSPLNNASLVNATYRVAPESGLGLNKLSYVGPIVMGFGGEFPKLVCKRT